MWVSGHMLTKNAHMKLTGRRMRRSGPERDDFVIQVDRSAKDWISAGSNQLLDCHYIKVLKLRNLWRHGQKLFVN